MKMKCSLEMAVVMVVGLSLVSRVAQPGIHRAAGQKTQLGKAPVSPCGLERRLLLLLVTEVIWIARRWRDLFQMSAVPTQVTSWCLYQE